MSASYLNQIRGLVLSNHRALLSVYRCADGNETNILKIMDDESRLTGILKAVTRLKRDQVEGVLSRMPAPAIHRQANMNDVEAVLMARRCAIGY